MAAVSRLRLRKLREKYGVNLRDLSEVTGIDFSLIAKYENGRRNLSPKAYKQLADGIAKAVESTGKKQAAKELGEKVAKKILASRSKKEIDALLESLSEEGKEAAIPFFDAHIAAEQKKLGGEEGFKSRTANLTALAGLFGSESEPPGKVSDAYADSYPGTVSRLHALLELLSRKGIDDPIISGLIESLRREIADLEARNKELESAVAARQTTDADD